MDDLFFPAPSDDLQNALMDDSYLLTMESWDAPVIAERNPVANPYLSTVYAFKNAPESIDWLLSSGWANMPEADRDGFVAAILEVYPQQVEAIQTLYMNAFERLGDPEGLAYWTLGMLRLGASNPTNLLSPAINESPEYVGMLKTALGDRADLAPLTTGLAIETHIRSLDGATRHDLYGKLVDTLYDNVFGRVAEASGKAYWTGELEKGSVNLLQVMGALINGAGTADQTLLDIKSDIAYDAVMAFVDRNIITNQDIAKAGPAKIQAALTGMQERLSEYDATEITALWADRDDLIAQMLRDAGLV